MRRIWIALLAAAGLAGCASGPLKVDLSDSVYQGSPPSDQKPQVSAVVVVNRAPPGKPVNSVSLGDAQFPLSVAEPASETVENDIRRYFSERLAEDPQATRALRVTIQRADAFWVLTTADRIPIVNIFTIAAPSDIGLNLRVRLEVEESGKVMASYDYDEVIPSRGTLTSDEQVANVYRTLISAYRQAFFGRLDQEFTGRYF